MNILSRRGAVHELKLLLEEEPKPVKKVRKMVKEGAK